MKVALLGSTGLIGKSVAQLLSRLDDVESVFCPVRSVPDLNALGIFNGISKFNFERRRDLLPGDDAQTGGE